MEFYYTYDYKKSTDKNNRFRRKTILYEMSFEDFGKRLNTKKFKFYFKDRRPEGMSEWNYQWYLKHTKRFKTCFTYDEVLEKCPNFDVNPNQYYKEPINIPKRKKLMPYKN